MIVEKVRVLILALPVHVIDRLTESLCIFHVSRCEQHYLKMRVEFD